MIDLSNWKLTLPVNPEGKLSGQGDASEVWKLAGYSKLPYFAQTAEAVTFTAPSEGARTGGSKYPRCELRQMRDGDEYEWTVEQGGKLSASLTVDEVSKTSEGKPGRVVIGQIHGPDDELCRLYFDNGRLYFYDDKAGPSPKETQFVLKSVDLLETKIPLGSEFTFTINVTETVLLVTAVHEGITYKAMDPISKFWLGEKLYFKAGVCNQVSKIGSGAGTVGIGQAKATFSEISLDGAVGFNPPLVIPPVVMPTKGKTICKVIVTFSDGTTATL